MPKMKVEIVTVERMVYSGEADMVVAPGIEGVLGILPRHAPLLTALQVGELRVKNDGQEISMAIGGGFMEVSPDKVIILADTAERAEEIDIARAEAARERAERLLRERPEGVDLAGIEGALRRSRIRLKVASLRRRPREARSPEKESGH